jgi:flavin reductase (DIM6/NTAB) family NADH-FMN oxidoreductase RutF
MNNDMVMLFRRLTLGVYIIGVAHGAQRDAFTASAIMQASYDPLMLALAINPEHASYALLRAGRTFSVAVLEQQQLELARRFGTTAPGSADKMHSVAWRIGKRGAPIVDSALAFFDCAVQAEMPAGDHRIVLGQVIDGAILMPEGKPLVYSATGNLDQSASLYPDRF